MTTVYASRAAAPIARMYRINEFFFAQALDGLTDTDLWRRPAENGNPMFWIAGHMVDTRALVPKALGEEFELPWQDQFKRYSKISDPSGYPDIALIRSTMARIGDRISVLLAEVDDEQLSQAATGVGVPNAKTLMDEISQLAWHDSYHLGQMGYLRKALGFQAMVG
ncbi:DinB family protein [Acidicapsa acidisoli]|uniref:DinB family protein n=1 Tax=Acidicapsa acidisoli TaxID=1615681 RepID=UPI0021DFFC46|nr:DinB family protein [Acidicapsa acidisoli]